MIDAVDSREDIEIAFGQPWLRRAEALVERARAQAREEGGDDIAVARGQRPDGQIGYRVSQENASTTFPSGSTTLAANVRLVCSSRMRGGSSDCPPAASAEL